MKPTQEELATTLYESLLAYEDAFAVLDGKVRTVFNRQVGTITALEKQVRELRERIHGELEVSEQVVQEREELILDNERLQKALEQIATGNYGSADCMLFARLALKEGDQIDHI